MIDGKIAGMARDLVAEQQEQHDAEHKEETAYRSLCEGLPVLLRTAGLTRTVTFLAAKEKSGAEYQAILDHMQKQLKAVGIYTNAKENSLDLPLWVTSKERKTAEYRHVSVLAFRVAYWHKRLAQALLRKKGEQ